MVFSLCLFSEILLEWITYIHFPVQKSNHIVLKSGTINELKSGVTKLKLKIKAKSNKN